MEESKQRKNGVILSYVSIAINILIQLIFTPFLIRKLGQNEYGLYSLISSIIGYLTVLDLGFGNAIIVYTAKYRAQNKYEEEKKLHGMFMIIFCIIGIIATILGLILFFYVENFFGNTMTDNELKKAKIMMLILTFNLSITFPFSIYSSIISAYEKFTFQKLVSILSSLLRPVLMIPLLFIGYKSISMTIVITIINILILLLNYLYCRHKLSIRIKYKGFDKKVFFEIFGYSFFIFLGIVVDKVNWSVDQFVLGAVSGTIAVSLYSVASHFNTLYMNVSSCCCGVMLPKLSKMVSKKVSDKELSDEYIKFGRLQWYLMLLILSGFIIYGMDFIKIWAGNEFKESYYIALILIIPIAFVLTENIGVYIMQAKNMHKMKAILTFISAVFNLIISIPLAKKLGGIGSALGTSISLIICNLIIINIYYQKVVKLDVIKFWKNIIKISMPIVPITILWYIVNIKVYHAGNYFSIGISAILFSIVYFAMSYMFAFNNYEKDLVKSLIFKLRKVVKKNATNN